MNIDMAALNMLSREREIPLDKLIPTIEQALLIAYHRTPGAHETARAELDRRNGHGTADHPAASARSRDRPHLR